MHHAANLSSYSHYVFSAISRDGETISFEDWAGCLALLVAAVSLDWLQHCSTVQVRGDTEDRLLWTFRLYDLDGDGLLSQEEVGSVLCWAVLVCQVEDLAVSVAELMGEGGRADQESILSNARRAFQVQMAVLVID